MSNPNWYTTESAAQEVGTSRLTVWRTCRDNPGFAVRMGGTYKIPPEHIERVKRGERPSDIAAEVRANGPHKAA